MTFIESVTYTKVEKSPDFVGTAHKLQVYALSTCAFCERALQFLKAQGLEHEFIFVDNLDPETKRSLKAELKEKYGNIPVFPLLVVDETTGLSGFTEEKWREAIGL